MKKYSEEDLLKVIREHRRQNRPATKRDYSDPSTVKFIQSYDIQSGEIKVPTYRIYYEYFRVWTAMASTDKVSKIEFFRNFNQYFTQKRNGNQRFYCLNECLDMSEDMMLKALQYDVKKHRKGTLCVKKKQKKIAE